MSFQFEQALRRKCEQNPDVALLFAQWEYDRRLVADALSTVSRFFPHYSRHDASHSNTILVQLARVLGPARIEALSATDIWLLLEAAYQHDIGMVVTDEQARTWWRSADFKSFLGELRQGHDPDLRVSAELLAGQQGKGEPGHDWPLDASRALTLVVAEYARRQHARSAERIIRDPQRTIGLLSPRTPLIPERLFDLLGTICAHHGRNFAETMELPHAESGLGTEDAHPRFVACMLRLGDLLDLDNGRFCPVMMKSFGALPASSMAHVEKHASIKHLLVGPMSIEVEAECPDYPSYEITEQWLTWLRDELKDQMGRWSDIVPGRDFGALPSLGRIQARVKGYVALEPGRRPRFEVDRESVLKLVRGANIYEHPSSCMRELLQNAVDATLIRVFRERWSRLPAEKLEAMTPADLRKELQGYPIQVQFDRIGVDAASGGKVRWRITMQDRGTGISVEDLRYIQRIGSSWKNPDRRRTIMAMPEWMQPSGIFGIGLQSVFLFTDKVVLQTLHHKTHESLEITLHNEEGRNSDGFSIRRFEREVAEGMDIGTRIEFELLVERIPHSAVSLQSHHLDLWKSFDPLAMDEFPHIILAAQDVVQSFAEACYCTIELNSKRLASDPFGPAHEVIFDRENGIELVIEPTASSTTTTEMYYRGAPVDDYAPPRSALNIRCNIHAGRADKLLHLSREEFTSEGWDFAYKRLERRFVRFPLVYAAMATTPPRRWMTSKFSTAA
jgi:hypothetical protein